MAIAVCLLSAIWPFLLLGWSELAALCCGVALFAIPLAAPLLFDRRLTDLDRADRLAQAWLSTGPDPQQVALLARGPGRIAGTEPAWRALTRAGLLRHRRWYSTFGQASVPLNELPNVYVGALLGSGFGLVGAVFVVLMNRFGTTSSTVAVAVVVAMLAFAGVEYAARRVGSRVGERTTWLDVGDPRTPAGHRALHLLSTSADELRGESAR